MNVALYTRYSSDKQSETSTEQQLKVCHEHCKRNNYTIVSEYSDEAISGRTDLRPEFQKMMEDSKRKLFQGIVIYSVDRFGRTLYQSAMYTDKLLKSGVLLISATEHISGDGAAGKLTLNMLMVFAQYYSDELSQKVTRGMDYNAEHGYANGGQIPLGYRTINSESMDGKKVFAIDEAAAPIVKRIFEMYADEHKTMAEICRHFNDQGIKTSSGVDFNKCSLRLLLRNRRYIGIYTYCDKEYPGLMPRIIDDDLFERAQQALTKNKKAPARKKAVGEGEYLLTLKLFCGHCKEMMTGYSSRGGTGKKYRYYKCTNRAKRLCNKKDVWKERIEGIVVEQCRAVLTDANIEKIASEIVAYNEAEQQNNETLKMLVKLVADNKKQQANLMSTLKLCEDDDTKSIILAEIAKMGREAKELQIQLAKEESRKITISRREIRFFLSDLQNGDVTDLKYKKTLIRVLVHKIYLYDDGRLTIVFYNGDTTTEVNINLIDDIEKEVPVCGGGGSYNTDDVYSAGIS